MAFVRYFIRYLHATEGTINLKISIIKQVEKYMSKLGIGCDNFNCSKNGFIVRIVFTNRFDTNGTFLSYFVQFGTPIQ